MFDVRLTFNHLGQTGWFVFYRCLVILEELVAMRSKYDRLEERLETVEQKLGLQPG